MAWHANVISFDRIHVYNKLIMRLIIGFPPFQFPIFGNHYITRVQVYVIIIISFAHVDKLILSSVYTVDWR